MTKQAKSATEQKIAKDQKPRDKKPCSTCAEIIQAQAKKCTHCDSYQDWRKPFSTSTNVLSLLVALVAVIGSTAPVLIKLFHEPKAQIAFSYQDGNSGRISILFANNGDGPGSLSTGAIRFPNGMQVPLERPGQQDGILVGPGQMILADFAAIQDVKEVPGKGEWCNIEFFQVVPKKRPQLLTQPTPCGLLRWLWMKPNVGG